MGNLLACFGGKEKSSSSSSRRRPPAKRRSRPCHQQQQQKQVYGLHEANGHTAALLPAAAKPASPDPNAAADCNDKASIHGLPLSCGEENVQLQQPLSGIPDATSSVHVSKQPSFKRSPTAAELGPSSSPKKKVTFDLNVKAYDHVPTAEELEEEEEDPERAEVEPLVKADQGIGRKVQAGPEYPQNNRYQNCAASDDEEDDDDDGLFCDLDEEDDDDGCYEDPDLEEDAIGTQRVEEEESFDSYFSLQMDKDRSRGDHNSDEEEDISVTSQDSKSVTPVVVNRGAAAAPRDRSKYINSVLNPVENITQWKDVKAGGRKTVQVKQAPQEKENIKVKEKTTSSLELPILTGSSSNLQNSLDSTSPWTPTTAATKSAGAKGGEVSVDTSLSSWLTPTTTAAAAAAVAHAKASSRCSNSSYSQETSYRSNTNSYTSLEERPILGALTVDDIKRSATPSSASPRKSPSRTPDDMPIMGTVGSYWKHTEQEADSRLAGTTGTGSAASAKGIPNSTSKYREDKRVNWHSSPFEVRLERALNKGSPAVPYAVC